MIKRYILSGTVVVAALCTTGGVRADTPAPMRHLVYSFQYGSQQTASARDNPNTPMQADMSSGTPNGSNSTIAGGSGMSHYRGNLGDMGTMTVDVLKEQPDKGLIVMVSEQGESTRKAAPAMCVAYGNTTVICDPNKTVNPEEYTLVRFLASNFVDPNQIDAKQQWKVSQDSGGYQVQANYTIASNNDGVMAIAETRDVKQVNNPTLTTNVQTKIDYNFPRLVPTMIDEYVTQRSEGGVGGNATTIYQTRLQLVSDSMATKP